MSYGVKAAERLAGKTILITGASAGIGEATALELAAAANGKIRLILTARRLERLHAVQEKLEKQFSSIAVYASKLDVSDYKKIPSFVSSLPAEWSKIDVLVNNAGLALGLDKVGNIRADHIETMIFTNVIGLITLTNALVPKFREQNSGDIVMIGSVAGRDAYPGASIYCSTKAALKSFTNALRAETIDSGIRVIEVDPGAVETEFSLVRFEGDKSRADSVYTGTEPLSPEDIAESITFALTRRQNTVVSDIAVFPTHQAGAPYLYRKPA